MHTYIYIYTYIYIQREREREKDRERERRNLLDGFGSLWAKMTVVYTNSFSR
jgi:hypothetical protein